MANLSFRNKNVRSASHEKLHDAQNSRRSKDNCLISPLSGDCTSYDQIMNDSISHVHYCGHRGQCASLGLEPMLSDYNADDFSAVNSVCNALSQADINRTMFDMPENFDFATAFTNMQSCQDCTSTTIPHHHHPSGRLAGASATLAGHFCCSWLVHGQPCFLCFESAEALDNHIKNDHAGKDGTYQCLWQNCSKHDNSMQTAGAMNFGNKPKLMRHVHSHTGYKPFPCPHPGCDKGFVTKEQLRNHETTHTKSRRYKCNQCGKAFAVKSALTTHITAVHDEKKIHSCDICGKCFADSSNLSKHKQTHFKDHSVRKRRNTREAESVTSTRSSPSASTISIETVTPIMGVASLQDLCDASPSARRMAPSIAPKSTLPDVYGQTPMPYSAFPTMSTTSSPPPESFDPDCYCCDQQCPLPEGPATPCNEADDCDLDGFCCDERCTPPNGLVAPCTDPESCDLEGFCNLPDCLPEKDCSLTLASSQESVASRHCNELLSHHQIEQLRNYQISSRRNEVSKCINPDMQHSASHQELEEQLTYMHGS